MIHELRVYRCMPGRLPDLNRRFAVGAEYRSKPDQLPGLREAPAASAGTR